MIDYLEIIEVVYASEIDQIIEIKTSGLIKKTTDFSNRVTLY